MESINNTKVSMAKKIRLVEIEPGCIACGVCEFVAPEVFEVSNSCKVKEGVDLEKNGEKIEEAAALCPVWVIAVHKEE